FDAAVRRGDTASLEQAIRLYQGELLEGCADAWVVPEREARSQAYLTALETLAGDAATRRDFATAERYLRLALAADPLRETALRALMAALAARGEHAALTQVYRDFRLYLHRELHAETSEETSALYRRLMASQSAHKQTAVDVSAS